MAITLRMPTFILALTALLLSVGWARGVGVANGAVREGGGGTEAASWPLYVNPIYGWEIRYPPGWTFLGPIPCVSEATSSSDVRRDPEEYRRDIVVFTSGLRNPGESLDETAAFRLRLARTGVNKDALRSEEEVSLEGGKAVVLRFESEGGGGTVVFAWSEETFLEIAAGATDNVGSAMLDAMLPTLRFTAPTVTRC